MVDFQFVNALLGKPERAQGKVTFDASDHMSDHTQKFTVRMRKPPTVSVDASDRTSNHTQKFT